MNISKLTVGVKNSISCRTTLSPNPHLVEERTCFLFSFFHRDMVCNKLNSHMLQQQGIRFYIPPELTYFLFFAYCHELLNRESYDGFIVLFEKELQFNLLITGRNFENLSYLSSCLLSQRWRFRRIPANVVRGIESTNDYIKVLRVASQYILRSGSLSPPLSSSMVKICEFFH